MNALRRDLFERRLWPLAALLLVAVVAVPLVMLGHASTDSAGVATPPHISLPPLTTSTSASTKAPTFVLGKPRNPFASDTPKLSATPAAPLSSSTAGSSATSSTTSTASTTTTPASTATATTPTT
ncbi:MAG: hypothetical protein ABSG43_24325, partial [Solirubrobacteraceae bacterium]